MRWFVPLLLPAVIVIGVPALAQLGQIGPSGDFRVNDRPGEAPTVGPPGGPSLPMESTTFRDFVGAKSPDEIVKSLDRDLGRNQLGDPGSTSSGPSLNVEKDPPPRRTDNLDR